MLERVFLLVDGSNFYHRLRENNLSELLKFNYGKFAQFLIGDLNPLYKNTMSGQLGKNLAIHVVES